MDEFGDGPGRAEERGSDPGPACYGRGGAQATLTDALVVLGYLSPERLAGGAVAIDAGAAEEALAAARPNSAWDTIEAAYASSNSPSRR